VDLCEGRWNQDWQGFGRLLASFQNHLSDAGDHARRLKRGGDKEFVYLEAEEAEKRYRLEPVE
jgi:hypothetical protein